MKRLFDFSVAIGILVCLPLLFVISGFNLKVIKNTFMVLVGKNTWVGYVGAKEGSKVKYPKIKPWVMSIAETEISAEDVAHKLNLIYAKDYTVSKDVTVFVRNLKKTWQ